MNEAHPSAKMPALDMRGVSIGSLKNPALRVATEVNWKVSTGEFWVVGARQHSGKSDFLMTAGGIIPPTAGEYFFLGERMPIFEESQMAHRLKLGFVFDGGRLLGQLTLGENIALPLRYHGHWQDHEVETRVRDLLAATELMPWANSTPANVGRSWRQRAGLARALALRPEVLLLDSPLTGLDARHMTWWLGFLDRLSRGHDLLDGRRLTLVATADDLRPWRRHAGRVACLAERRLTVLGDWDTATASGESVLQELLHD